jgi:hypothetical protein
LSVTKLFVLRKDNKFVAWDGKSLTDKPSEALRASLTLGKRKYPEFEMLTFPDAYDQWFMGKKNNGRIEGGKE